MTATDIATQIASVLRPIAPEGRLDTADVPHIDALAANWARRDAGAGAERENKGGGLQGAAEAVTRSDGLTARIVMELIAHEAIVQEAYRDSVGVWTWAVGVTNASGHEVYPRYKDNAQPLAKCIEVSVWLMREKYLPAVLRAFRGRELTEAQLGAALSFHYNTGAIEQAGWVRSFLAGKPTEARAKIMEWRSPPEIVGRRTKERNLFFDGRWSSDGRATVYPVRKPAYAPDWRRPERVDIREAVAAALGGGA